MLEEEADMFHNPRLRPNLIVLFTSDGRMHLVESDQIVSVTVLMGGGFWELRKQTMKPSLTRVKNSFPMPDRTVLIP